jgi:hypothetical protein
MVLLAIDSRDRENPSANTDSIRIVLENSIQFRKISLIFMDLPIDTNEAGDSECSYYMKIRELPSNVRGAQYGDAASFILIKNSAVGFRSMSFENESYAQEIDIGEPKMFSELNISLHYRKNAATTLSMTSDWSAIFRIE